MSANDANTNANDDDANANEDRGTKAILDIVALSDIAKEYSAEALQLYSVADDCNEHDAAFVKIFELMELINGIVQEINTIGLKEYYGDDHHDSDDAAAADDDSNEGSGDNVDDDDK